MRNKTAQEKEDHNAAVRYIRDPNVLFSAICPRCKRPTQVSRLLHMECCGHKYPTPKGIPETLFKQYILNIPGANDEYNDRMEYLSRPRI